MKLLLCFLILRAGPSALKLSIYPCRIGDKRWGRVCRDVTLHLFICP